MVKKKINKNSKKSKKDNKLSNIELRVQTSYLSQISSIKPPIPTILPNPIEDIVVQAAPHIPPLDSSDYEEGLKEMKIKVLKGRSIVPGYCIGPALVSKKPISFLGGVDPKSGLIIERNHDLKGETINGKILCFPHGHGSTVGSYVIYSLIKNCLGPKAIVNEEADPVIVVGAIISNIPMIDQVDIQNITTGDEVEVDCNKGFVTILRKVANVIDP